MKNKTRKFKTIFIFMIAAAFLCQTATAENIYGAGISQLRALALAESNRGIGLGIANKKVAPDTVQPVLLDRGVRQSALSEHLQNGLTDFLKIFAERLNLEGNNIGLNENALGNVAHGIIGYNDNCVSLSDNVILYVDADTSTVTPEQRQQAHFDLPMLTDYETPLQEVEVTASIDETGTKGFLVPFGEFLNDILSHRGLIQQPIRWGDRDDWSSEFPFRIETGDGTAVKVSGFSDRKAIFRIGPKSGRVIDKRGIYNVPYKIPETGIELKGHTHGVFSDNFIKGPSNSDLIGQMRRAVDFAEGARQDFKGIFLAEFIVAELPQGGVFDLHVVVLEIDRKTLDEATVSCYTMVRKGGEWIKEEKIEEEEIPEGLQVPMENIPYLEFKRRVETAESKHIEVLDAIAADNDEKNPPILVFANGTAKVKLLPRPPKPTGQSEVISKSAVFELEASILRPLSFREREIEMVPVTLNDEPFGLMPGLPVQIEYTKPFFIEFAPLGNELEAIPRFLVINYDDLPDCFSFKTYLNPEIGFVIIQVNLFEEPLGGFSRTLEPPRKGLRDGEEVPLGRNWTYGRFNISNYLSSLISGEHVKITRNGNVITVEHLPSASDAPTVSTILPFKTLTYDADIWEIVSTDKKRILSLGGGDSLSVRTSLEKNRLKIVNGVMNKNGEIIQFSDPSKSLDQSVKIGIEEGRMFTFTIAISQTWNTEGPIYKFTLQSLRQTIKSRMIPHEAVQTLLCALAEANKTPGVDLPLLNTFSRGGVSQLEASILRPLAAREREPFIFYGPKSATYTSEEPFIKVALSNRELVEGSLRDVHGDANISLNDQIRPPVVFDAGFGNRLHAYHIRFFLTGNRIYDLTLVQYKDIHGIDDHLTTDQQIINDMQNLLQQNGCEDMLIRQGRTTTIKVEIPFSDGGSFSRTKICTFCEYGGLDGETLAASLLPRLFNTARDFKEEDLYKLVISGLISESEARDYGTQREALIRLVQGRIGMNRADEVKANMDAIGVAKYFELFQKTKGQYAISDPRRNNVLFRFDRGANQWIVRLTDFETAQRLSLADFIVQFDVFNPNYYTERGGIRYAEGGAGVRPWYWTTKVPREKMGFFRAAFKGLGSNQEASDILYKAFLEMSGYKGKYMFGEAGQCLLMYLVETGKIGFLRLMSAAERNSSQLEASILRPLAAAERNGQGWAGREIKYAKHYGAILDSYLKAYRDRAAKSSARLEYFRRAGIGALIEREEKVLNDAQRRNAEAENHVAEVKRLMKAETVSEFIRALRATGAVMQLDPQQESALSIADDVISKDTNFHFDKEEVLILPGSSWLLGLFNFEANTAGKLLAVTDGYRTADIIPISDRCKGIEMVKLILHEVTHKVYREGRILIRRSKPDEFTLFDILEEAVTESVAVHMLSEAVSDAGLRLGLAKLITESMGGEKGEFYGAVFKFQDIAKIIIEKDSPAYLERKELLNQIIKNWPTQAQHQPDIAIHRYLTTGDSGLLRDALGETWDKMLAMTGYMGEPVWKVLGLKIMADAFSQPDRADKLGSGIALLKNVKGAVDKIMMATHGMAHNPDKMVRLAAERLFGEILAADRQMSDDEIVNKLHQYAMEEVKKERSPGHKRSTAQIEASILRPLAMGERQTGQLNTSAKKLVNSLFPDNKPFDAQMYPAIDIEDAMEACLPENRIMFLQAVINELRNIQDRTGLVIAWRHMAFVLDLIINSGHINASVKEGAKMAKEELIKEVKAHLLLHAADSAEFIGESFKGNQVVILSDLHGSFDLDMFVAEVIPDLKKWGIDYLAIERETIYQGLIDEFLRTGEITPEIEFIARGTRAKGVFSPGVLEILKAARENGIKVICMDKRTIKTATSAGDKGMADVISGLGEGKKILVYVGEYHAMQHIANAEGPYLGERLRQINAGKTFSINQASSSMLRSESGLSDVLEKAVSGTRLEGKSFAVLTPNSKGPFNAFIFHGGLDHKVMATPAEWAKILTEQNGVKMIVPPHLADPAKLVDRNQAQEILLRGEFVFSYGAHKIDPVKFEAQEMAALKTIPQPLTQHQKRELAYDILRPLALSERHTLSNTEEPVKLELVESPSIFVRLAQSVKSIQGRILLFRLRRSGFTDQILYARVISHAQISDEAKLGVYEALKQKLNKGSLAARQEALALIVNMRHSQAHYVEHPDLISPAERRIWGAPLYDAAILKASKDLLEDAVEQGDQRIARTALWFIHETKFRAISSEVKDEMAKISEDLQPLLLRYAQRFIDMNWKERDLLISDIPHTIMLLLHLINRRENLNTLAGILGLSEEQARVLESHRVIILGNRHNSFTTEQCLAAESFLDTVTSTGNPLISWQDQIWGVMKSLRMTKDYRLAEAGNIVLFSNEPSSLGEFMATLFHEVGHNVHTNCLFPCKDLILNLYRASYESAQARRRNYKTSAAAGYLRDVYGDFARKYGAKNEDEDLATIVEAWGKDSQGLLDRGIGLAQIGRPWLLMKTLMAASLFTHLDNQGRACTYLYKIESVKEGTTIVKRQEARVAFDESVGVVDYIEGVRVPQVIKGDFGEKYGRLLVTGRSADIGAKSEPATLASDFFRGKTIPLSERSDLLDLIPISEGEIEAESSILRPVATEERGVIIYASQGAALGLRGIAEGFNNQEFKPHDGINEIADKEMRYINVEAGDASKDIEIQNGETVAVGSKGFAYCIAGALTWEINGKRYLWQEHSIPAWQIFKRRLKSKIERLVSKGAKDAKLVIHTNSASLKSGLDHFITGGPELESDDEIRRFFGREVALAIETKESIQTPDGKLASPATIVVGSNEGVAILFPAEFSHLDRVIPWGNVNGPQFDEAVVGAETTRPVYNKTMAQVKASI